MKFNLPKKFRFLIFSTVIIIVSLLVIYSQTRFIPDTIKAITSLLPDKFCDDPSSPNQTGCTGAFIQSVLAVGSSPYQDVQGDVAVTGNLTVSNQVITNGRLTMTTANGAGPQTWHLDNINKNLRIFQQPTINDSGTVYMTIADGGKVGIGTGSPLGQLHIKTSPQWSSFNYGANLIIDGSRNNAIGILDSTSANPWAIVNVGGTLQFNRMPGLGDITSPPVNVVTIAWNDKVGIGTAAPDTALEVATEDSVSGLSFPGKLRISAAAPQIDFVDSDNIDWSIHANNNKLYFIREPWNYTDLVFDGTGKIGMGIDPPINKLHVGGSIGATSWIGAGCEVACETSGGYAILYPDGRIVATGVKSFEIPHPLDPTKKLVHAAIEGPEAGVYYRGEGRLVNGKALISLHDYFEALTAINHRTVLLTPKFDSDEPISNLAASAVKDGKFSVRAADSQNPSQKFYWEVKAIRNDIPPLVVEKPKGDK